MDPQQAVDALRVMWRFDGCISLEDGIGAQVSGLGEQVVISASRFGGRQMILIDEDSRARLGRCDPRKDGCAIER
jgi:gamma-glutamyltranspeptidase